MNIIALGITVTGFGAILLMIILKEYLVRGYIKNSAVLISKLAIIFITIGIIIFAIGWIWLN